MLVRRSAPGRSLLRRRARTSEGAFLWNTNSRGTRLQWILFLFFFFFSLFPAPSSSISLSLLFVSPSSVVWAADRSPQNAERVSIINPRPTISLWPSSSRLILTRLDSTRLGFARLLTSSSISWRSFSMVSFFFFEKKADSERDWQWESFLELSVEMRSMNHRRSSGTM